ncbi:MAG TPA: lipopolysaccharide assembly protein LapA domain-containing protein [Gammaproteobacteria bacterium]|nr:lipopolysaccharide assembly protein LapA domain-containing protein [Gammaproteobacteria bacterium]HRP86414.1 lipopolysaccharide assembly protein LapA domain-containing protein [Gammaproteobacteria bacterium]
MVKRIFTAVIFLTALALSAFFTSLNPGEINLDLGFAALKAPLGLAFVAALALGWLLGVLSLFGWAARLAADRRRLRGELKRASAGGFAGQDERS